MGLDGMRVGGARCPPLLVAGLLVACLLLVCSWWSLSTENLELLRQLDELTEQLKKSTKERDQCIIMQEKLEESNKQMEGNVGELYVRLQQEKELKKQNGQISDLLTMCKSELDSLSKLDATRSATLEALRLEKDTVSKQLDVKKEEIQKLKSDLDTALTDIEKLKLTISLEKDKAPEKMPHGLTRGPIDEAQLGPVNESAVEISVSGQRGMKYHGVEILPRDPPDVTRPAPRVSVTMLKSRAPTTNPIADDNSGNDAKEAVDDVNADPNMVSDGGEETNRFNEAEDSLEVKNAPAQ